jgi:hypothetical protein
MEHTDSEISQELLLDHAEAYISLGYYDNALKDCSNISSPTTRTLTERHAIVSAQVLYQVRRYEKCLSQLKFSLPEIYGFY